MVKTLIILSGGMDSTTLLYKLVKEQGNKNVLAISFNYNQKHKKELDYAKKTCDKLDVSHKIVDITNLSQLMGNSALTSDIEVPEGHYADESMKQTVVPNRNMILLSLAIAHAITNDASVIYYGAHAGDHAIYPDCRPVFLEAMNNVAELCDYKKMSIKAPFMNIDKGDIAILGKELNVDYSLTWTCYKGKDKACGKCGACVERLEAFKKAQMMDPIEYEEEIK